MNIINKLSQVTYAVIQDWNGKTPLQRKAVIDALYGFRATTNVLRAWDIDELAWHKYLFTQNNAPGYCPDTVTVNGFVFPSEEVNYFLWGLVNRLANASGLLTGGIFTAKFAVTLHRTVNPRNAIYTGTGHLDGRLAWTEAGWASYNGSVVSAVPNYTALLGCMPNISSYTQSFWVHAGDARQTQVVNRIDLII